MSANGRHQEKRARADVRRSWKEPIRTRRTPDREMKPECRWVCPFRGSFPSKDIDENHRRAHGRDEQADTEALMEQAEEAGMSQVTVQTVDTATSERQKLAEAFGATMDTQDEADSLQKPLKPSSLKSNSSATAGEGRSSDAAATADKAAQGDSVGARPDAVGHGRDGRRGAGMTAEAGAALEAMPDEPATPTRPPSRWARTVQRS